MRDNIQGNVNARHERAKLCRSVAHSGRFIARCQYFRGWSRIRRRTSAGAFGASCGAEATAPVVCLTQAHATSSRKIAFAPGICNGVSSTKLDKKCRDRSWKRSVQDAGGDGRCRRCTNTCTSRRYALRISAPHRTAWTHSSSVVVWAR